MVTKRGRGNIDAAIEAKTTTRLTDALYRHLNVTSNPDLIDLDRFWLMTEKKGATHFEFYNSDRWVPLTKQTGEFFAPKTLRDRFGVVNAMKKFLGNETPPLLERSLKAASKLKRELPTDLQMESILLKELSSLVTKDMKTFMLRHGKYHKILALICENF